MKLLMCGLTMSLGILASAVNAEQMINVDGTDVPLSTLMSNCQSITNDPQAQIACFGAISQLLEQQSGAGQKDDASIAQALDALRAVAQYQDDESGLVIAGSNCTVQVVYFNNYYHLSRRNISSLDLYSAQFDASKLQFDKIAPVQGAQAPLSKGVLNLGATAAMRGGMNLESATQNFPPRSPRTSLGDYANEVVSQLPVREDQVFEFVLIHPKRSQASAEIWSAFEAFVNECSA